MGGTGVLLGAQSVFYTVHESHSNTSFSDAFASFAKNYLQNNMNDVINLPKVAGNSISFGQKLLL